MKRKVDSISEPAPRARNVRMRADTPYAPTAPTAEDLVAALNALIAREQAVAAREQAVAAREQAVLASERQPMRPHWVY